MRKPSKPVRLSDVGHQQPAESGGLVIFMVFVANFFLSMWNCVAETATGHPMWGFDAALAFQGARGFILFWLVMSVMLPQRRFSVMPRPEHRAQVLKLGLSFTMIPICYIMGLQRAGPVVTSIYEGPLIPVATMAVVMATGSKPLPSTLAMWGRDIAPLAVASVGALVVILYKPEGHPHHSNHALHPAGHRRGLPNEHPDGPLSIDGGLHAPHGSDYLLGNLLLGCVSVGHALYYSLNNELIPHYPAPLLASWTGLCTGSLYTTLLLCRAVLGMHSGTGTSLEFVRDHLFVDRSLWGTMVFGIVFVQLGTYIIIPWAAKRLSPLAISMFNLSGPGLTAALSHFWLDEEVNPVQVAGMALTAVALGFYLWLNKNPDSTAASKDSTH